MSRFGACACTFGRAYGSSSPKIGVSGKVDERKFDAGACNFTDPVCPRNRHRFPKVATRSADILSIA
jgi:hypothetical protein